jgi:flagellar biosynthetic protein FliR
VIDALFINQNEILSFFMVLIRISVLVMVLPFFGDRSIPGPVKVLLSLALSVMVYPILISKGYILVTDVERWGRSPSTLIGAVFTEVFVGILLGFVARLFFMAIDFSGNLIGTFMGYGNASMFDPHQESHTQVVSQFHNALAMLLFLALNGHHMFLKAFVSSYKIVGVAKANITSTGLPEYLIHLSAEVIMIALQLAAPMAIVFFMINIFFGVMAKAVPQLNVLILSMGVSALVGMLVMVIQLPEFQSVTSDLFEKMNSEMQTVLIKVAS